ncbi:MAG: hypothetical protein IJG49_00995 [Erysipelotrichaceae bacterium]|nr:hypothetical protein [Erysipelotrichaceae bacterium]
MGIKEWIGFAIIVFVGLKLMPVIGQLLSFLLVVALIFARYIFFQSMSTKKDIEANPAEYFAKQFEEREKEKVPVENKVIDAEYKVKEAEEEKND